MSSKFGDVLDSGDLNDRNFSFGDSGEFEGSIFDFKSSLPNVSYAASTGGPHTLSTPKPSKPAQNFPLGTTSISGGIASRHPPQESFLHKFASIADATREIELTNSLSTVTLDGGDPRRRTSFGSDAASVKPFNISPHGSMNENLNISSRNSRHQSISEKIDNYNNNSPIQATASLSNVEAASSSNVAENSQNHNPGFWNPATATSFTPHQSFNYFLDGSLPPQPVAAIGQSNYARGTPFYPPISPPPFAMGSPPFMDSGMYGMMPYPMMPMLLDPVPAESSEEKKESAEHGKKLPQKSGALPGVGLMNRSSQQNPAGYMFQPFVPFSMYGPAQVPNNSAADVPGKLQSPPNRNVDTGVSAAPNSQVPLATRSGTASTLSGPGKKYKNGKGGPSGGKASHHIYRSPLLEEVRSNAKGKDYFLRDIYGHIVEFTKDQHGSRFIQQKLPSATHEEKEVAFNELRDIALELMTDVFGNYVIQKYFEHGSETQKQVLLESMSGEVYELSLQMYGCRVVQRALEYVPLEGQRSIVEELRSHILVCAKDQNGNHVIQKSIEKIPIEHVGFILDSLRNHIYHLSTHPYGCRVIQRLLEHSSPADQQFILGELKRFIFYLIQDQYGNYVIQHILEHGDNADQEEILKIALGSIVNFSKHKFASNVIEKCIKHGTLEQRRRIHAEVMLGNEDIEKEYVDDDSPLAFMMKDQYANYVIQKLVEGFGPKSSEKRMLVVKLRQYLKQLAMKNNYGKHLASVEKMIAVAETALVEVDEP